MSEQIILKAQKRDGLGKGANHRLREEDMIPCVFYDNKGTNIAIQVEALSLQKAFETAGRTAVFQLEIEDADTTTTHPVLFWDILSHPYKNKFKHVDFFGVDLDKEIKIRVPLEFVGTSRGVKLGGTLEIYREFLDILSKPMDIPAKITIDLTELDVNTTILLKNVEFPKGVRSATQENFAILSITAPKA